MGSSLLRLISRKTGAAESSFRWISRKGASCGIFKSPANVCGSTKDARMISSMSVSSGESSVLRPSTLPSRISPWLMLPPAFEGGEMVYKFYSLAENKVLSFNKRGGGGGDEELPDDAKCVGSSHGWLALFNKRNCDVFLSNPISRRHIKLPPIHTLPIPENNLRGGFACVHQVIISCSPDDEEECRAMMSFGPEHRLAFCWPGRSTEWTPIDSLSRNKCARPYEAFVHSSRQKLFFCATNDYEFEAWDLRDPRSPSMIPMDVSVDSCQRSWWSESEEEQCRQMVYADHCDTWRSLVVAEQSDELYYVTRFVMMKIAPDGFPVAETDYSDDEDYNADDEDYHKSIPYKTIGFDVHKYNRENREFRCMDRSLDGLALFIGNNHSFALSAKEFPELNPNAIYFTDVEEPTPVDVCSDLPYGGHDLGIFNYENRAMSPCYYPCDVPSIKRIQPAPIWFTPTPRPNVFN